MRTSVFPLYQYDDCIGSDRQCVISLEPVYGGAEGGGGSPEWVRWFFDQLVNETCLAFAYTQAGQENSFIWEKMKDGLNDQIPYIAELRKHGWLMELTWFRNTPGIRRTDRTCLTYNLNGHEYDLVLESGHLTDDDIGRGKCSIQPENHLIRMRTARNK